MTPTTTSEQDNFALTLPITQAARRTAQEFAHQQPTPEKAEQVLLNTLSVWVVNDYLELMSIPTDKRVSDSWNPVVRLCADVADLMLPRGGRLECRPVREHQQMCYIPPETWEERVGYVIVQVDESLQFAKLLGFVRSIATEELPLSQLQPLSDLLEHLGQLKQTPVRTSVNLRSWFAGIFEPDWQTIESLWNEPKFRAAYAFRSIGIVEEKPNDPQDDLSGLSNPALSHRHEGNPPPHQKEALIRRAKLIDLGIQIANQPIILILEVRPEADQQTSICLQLHPTGNEIYLLPGLQMTVLDESGAVFLEAKARDADNYIQLQFRGELGEQFSVMLALNHPILTEDFVI